MSSFFEKIFQYLDRHYPKGDRMTTTGTTGQKVLTFLSKLGGVLAKGLAIAAGVGPIIAPFLGSQAQPIVPTAVNDLTQITQVVTSAETFITAPGSGAQKLAAVTPLVLAILKTSQAFYGKSISDEALAEKGASEVVQGIVDFMNAIHPEAVPVKTA